jgi:hypothetical protein
VPLTTSASTSNGGADQIAAQNHHPPNGTADGGVGRVENLLEGAVETLRQLSIIVEDYHEHQPPTFLFDKMCVTYHMCPLCSFFPFCCNPTGGVWWSCADVATTVMDSWRSLRSWTEPDTSTLTSTCRCRYSS